MKDLVKQNRQKRRFKIRKGLNKAKIKRWRKKDQENAGSRKGKIKQSKIKKEDI